MKTEHSIIVGAIKCPKCKEVIYSRARHDMRSCSCGEVAVDGGFDYLKVSYKKKAPSTMQIRITATKKQLYDDWNNNKNKFGILKGKDAKEAEMKAIESGAAKRMFEPEEE